MTAAKGQHTDYCDGTLIDTVPDLANALNQVLREHGHAPFAPREVQNMVGDGIPALVTRGFASRGADAAEAREALPRFLAFYEANATNLSRPYPGVRDTLALLRRQGYRTAVCTNKAERRCWWRWTSIGPQPWTNSKRWASNWQFRSSSARARRMS